MEVQDFAFIVNAHLSGWKLGDQNFKGKNCWLSNVLLKRDLIRLKWKVSTERFIKWILSSLHEIGLPWKSFRIFWVYWTWLQFCIVEWYALQGHPIKVIALTTRESSSQIWKISIKSNFLSWIYVDLFMHSIFWLKSRPQSKVSRETEISFQNFSSLKTRDPSRRKC